MIRIIDIDNFDSKETVVYKVMSERELLHAREPFPGYFIAESPYVIQRALSAGYEAVSFLMEKGMEGHPDHRFLEELQVPVYLASKEMMRDLAGYGMTRGLLSLMKRREMPDMEELCREKRRIAVLEDVMNPSNIGAIFRSAAALGMEAVLLAGGCSDPLYRRAARVSMGTVFQIPWTYAPAGWHGLLHDMGFSTCAMALRDNSMSISDPALRESGQLAVLLGSEGYGLKPDTIDACNYTVMIPMSAGVDSLNVAAASAVAFWELGKK